MVAIVGAVAVIALSGGAAAPIIAAAAPAATGAGAGAAAAGAGAAAAGAGAAAAGAGVAAAGAGAAASTVTVAGTVAAGSASAGTAGVTLGVALTGPVGLCILGTDEAATPSDTTSNPLANYNFDCWKPLLHDNSPTPSSGMLLKDVFADKRIKLVTDTGESNLSSTEFPGLVFENIWDEQFRIDYLYLPNGQLAAHAVRL